MRNSFNYYKQVESPNMYLCNPNRDIIGTVIAESRNVTLRFNDLSELTFTVYKGLCAEEVYKKIETRRLIFVEQIGWFQITSVTDNAEGDSESKEVSCESHQTQLKSRGFISEERVYMFYNPNDSRDDLYDSISTAAIPSVIGQLNKQLGLNLKINKTEYDPEEDFGEWTIIYIDESLYYKAKSYDEMYVSNSDDNICRSFSSSTTFGYDFIINDVEEAFEVVFEFDILHHAIKIKRLEDITKETNVYLSLDNLAESISVSENADDIVTVLSCSGNDIDIRTVNPMGTNYIVNFDYYKKEEDVNGTTTYPWMSKTLIEGLDEWSAAYEESKEAYGELVLELQKTYQKQTEINNKLTVAKLKIGDLTTAQDKYVDESYDVADGLEVLETVMLGEKSLWSYSDFFENAFSEEASIECYYYQPKIEKSGENDYAINWWSETGYKTSEGTSINVMIDGYISADERNDDGTWEPSEDSKASLYFTDGVDALGRMRSYCKLLVSAEVDVVKNEDGDISESGTITMNGVTFYIKTSGSSENFSVSNDNGYSESVSKSKPYFTYNNITYKIKKTADDVVSVYGFYISGFKRYAPYGALVGEDSTNNWIDLWTSHQTSVEKSELEPLKKQVEDYEKEMNKIADKCEVGAFIKEKGDTLYNELQNYWIEGEYTNDTISATDDTTIDERIELAKELIEAGEKELEKVSQPTFELSVSAINFLKLIEFRTFSDELELGRVIVVERDENTHYRPALVSLEYDLDDSETLSLTFSTAAKLDETSMTFADLLNETSSTSRTVSANWSNLTDYTKNKQTITDLLNEPLNRTLRAAQGNMNNQEFSIDTTGILGRKWSDDSHTAYDSQQVRIANNTIIFTNDGWKTIKTALGKISYTDNESEQTAYGLLAEVLVGNLIFSKEMRIQNESATISLDELGITIRDSEENTVFFADAKGQDSLIGGFKIGQSAIYNGISSMDLSSDEDSDQSGVYIGIDGINLGGNFVVTKDGVVTINKGSVSLGDNFSVTNEGLLEAKNANVQGKIIAQEGKIGTIQLAPTGDSTTALFTDEFFLGTNTLEDGSTKTLLSFGKVEENKEGKYDIISTAFMEGGAICAPVGTFETVNINDGYVSRLESRTMEAWTLKVNSISSNAGNDTGFRFSVGESVHGYYAKLTVSESEYKIILKIYDTATDTEVTLAPDTRTFTICYRCIASTNEHEETVSVERGKEVSVTIETKAFFGIAYVSFDKANGSSKKSFLVEDETPDENIGCRGNLVPYGGTYSLGTSTSIWDAVYVKDGTVSSSDKKQKHDIKEISSSYDLMYDQLVPSTFVFNQNNSGRTHIGLIAQNLKEAIENAGLTTKDCAAYVEWKNEDGSTGCGIRYSELISLNIYEIQKLKKFVKQLKNEIRELKGE